MGNGSDDEAETFDGAAGFAGEADDEGLFDDGGEVAGEDGILRDLHRFDAHDFAETGEFAIGDFTDGFGGDVTQCDAGAAGGENELRALGDLFLDGALNFALFVGNEFFGDNSPAVTDGGLFKCRAAEIVVKPFRSAVGNGDDAGLDLHFVSVHFLVFETRWMLPMVICLSTALHMS